MTDRTNTGGDRDEKRPAGPLSVQYIHALQCPRANNRFGFPLFAFRFNQLQIAPQNDKPNANRKATAFIARPEALDSGRRIGILASCESDLLLISARR